MSQRKVYDPLLLASKSTQLLSLTAISGIILRTQHGQESTAQYACSNTSNYQIQEATRYLYANQQSILEDEEHRELEEQRKLIQAQKIQLEYERQIVRLKAIQLDKLLQINRSYSTTSSVGDKLNEVSKAREVFQQKKGKLRSSLQLMIIHLNRSYNWVIGQNRQMQRSFLYSLKEKARRQNGVEALQRVVNRLYSWGLEKVKKQQKVKKITLKPNKVVEIEDILRRQMQRHKKSDKENWEKTSCRRMKSKIAKFV